jgi:hypothetical protein
VTGGTFVTDSVAAIDFAHCDGPRRGGGAGIKARPFRCIQVLTMFRSALRARGFALAIVLLLVATPLLAANLPTLYSISAGTPKVLAQGAQKSWPIKLSEDSAFDAVFKGGMWLPTPAGGRVYVKYQRHILHANGTWTWVGTVSTVHGDQSVVLTFGKDGAFGLIPQASGYPLRIVTQGGETRVVATTAAALARSTQALGMFGRPDYMIPPRTLSKGVSVTSLQQASAAAPVRAAAAGPVTIDVMVAYTPGFVSELGSRTLVIARIQNLVDITNQAYVTSGVNQQIRLVKTVEVNYPDNTSNDSALNDLTGLDANGNPVPIPASLAGIAGLRTQYGADLVTMIRGYDNTVQGNCGEGWLIGGNQAPIVPSQSYIYGYSVVSDGSNNGYYCVDTTFAHELGHNMGDAHDRANATSSGAYAYSYGYVGGGTNGFSTIMAYGTATDTPLSVFSNPNISVCQNAPCGVADSSTSSADNVHSMNNTAALIAQFEPTKVTTPVPSAGSVHNDVNGDGKSDLVWRSRNNTQFAYWFMNGTQLTGSLGFPTPSDYRLVATGDFNGDGKMDILWTDGTGMWVWVGNGSTFTSTYMRPYPKGWTVVGAGDLNGDGKTDLIWTTKGRIAEWLMNGAAFSATYAQNLPAGWRYLTTGDFDGDGKADLLLTNGTAMQMWTSFSNGTFTQVATQTYPPGWAILGAGDINGDGDADLLWRDNIHTRFAYWIMHGPQLVDSKAISVSSQWQFGTAGDFDGSGLLGLVWYNSSQIVMWPGSSTGNYRGVVVHGYPSAWTLLP